MRASGFSISASDVWAQTMVKKATGVLGAASSFVIPAGRTVVAVKQENVNVTAAETSMEISYDGGTNWHPVVLEEDPTTEWGFEEEVWTPVPIILQSDGVIMRFSNSDPVNPCVDFAYLYYG